jgi:hypothetical protein
MSSFSRSPDPGDALRVQPVDWLVWQQHARVTGQGGRDAEPLSHAQGKRRGPPPGYRFQPGHSEHVLHTAPRDRVGPGQGEQVPGGAASRAIKIWLT